MNALDKIKNVQNGLNCCGSNCSTCSKCPYYDRDMCRKGLMREANEVINALRAELKKRTSKAPETMPGFITLTGGTAYSSDGRTVMMTENGKIAVRVDDILSVSDLVEVRGSEIRLNDARQTVFYACETIEEILAKVSDMRGE